MLPVQGLAWFLSPSPGISGHDLSPVAFPSTSCLGVPKGHSQVAAPPL